MMAISKRRYPVGIQTFSEIIKTGRVYVDKTDLMWQAQELSKYIFLSRPRRFGKSLLSTTFASFFRGEKELFEGLKVMQLEKEWETYPVIQLDLSTTKYAIPYQTDGRRVVKVGIRFSTETLAIEDWEIEG